MRNAKCEMVNGVGMGWVGVVVAAFIPTNTKAANSAYNLKASKNVKT